MVTRNLLQRLFLYFLAPGSPIWSEKFLTHTQPNLCKLLSLDNLSQSYKRPWHENSYTFYLHVRKNKTIFFFSSFLLSSPLLKLRLFFLQRLCDGMPLFWKKRFAQILSGSLVNYQKNLGSFETWGKLFPRWHFYIYVYRVSKVFMMVPGTCWLLTLKTDFGPGLKIIDIWFQRAQEL